MRARVRVHHAADLPDGQRVGRLFEGLLHRAAAKKPEITAATVAPTITPLLRFFRENVNLDVRTYVRTVKGNRERAVDAT